MKKIFSLCLLLGGLLPRSFVHVQSPPVTWSPSKLSINVATGTDYFTDVALTSVETELSLWVVPELTPDTYSIN